MLEIWISNLHQICTPLSPMNEPLSLSSTVSHIFFFWCNELAAAISKAMLLKRGMEAADFERVFACTAWQFLKQPCCINSLHQPLCEESYCTHLPILPSLQQTNHAQLLFLFFGPACFAKLLVALPPSQKRCFCCTKLFRLSDKLDVLRQSD